MSQMTLTLTRKDSYEERNNNVIKSGNFKNEAVSIQFPIDAAALVNGQAEFVFEFLIPFDVEESLSIVWSSDYSHGSRADKIWEVEACAFGDGKSATGKEIVHISRAPIQGQELYSKKEGRVQASCFGSKGGSVEATLIGLTNSLCAGETAEFTLNLTPNGFEPRKIKVELCGGLQLFRKYGQLFTMEEVTNKTYANFSIPKNVNLSCIPLKCVIPAKTPRSLPGEAISLSHQIKVTVKKSIFCSKVVIYFPIYVS